MRTYKRQMIADKQLYCDDCGDVIEPEDYYYRVTTKWDLPFMPDDKENICVGCHCLEHEVAVLESK